MFMADTKSWYMERVIFLIAGSVILFSLLMTWYVSPYWLILTGLVGANLIIFALTGYCIMANLLYTFGVRPKEI